MYGKLFRVILTVILLLAGTSLSQVQLGVQGGLNIADLKGEVTEGEGAGLELETDNQTGLGFGAVLYIPISKTFGILMEPGYLEKGANQKQEEADLTWKANYLEMPVLLKAGFGSGSVRPYLMAGPSIGINLGSDLKIGGGGLALKIDVKDLLTTTDFSLMFGGGVLFPFQSVNLYADVRYSLGLTDVFEGGTVTVLGLDLPIPDADIKTRGIQIMAGLLFPLGSKKSS